MTMPALEAADSSSVTRKSRTALVSAKVSS